MRVRNKQRQKGAALIEFSIAGIAAATLMIATVQLGIAMWNYHTLAYAVHETNRYISMHGRSCTTGGNNCTIYVKDIANKLKSYAVGIPDTSINMTLTSNSGTTYTCNPISSYEADNTQWPPVAHFDNNPGPTTYTTITASTTNASALIAMWYGWSGERISSITLKSTSKIPIIF